MNPLKGFRGYLLEQNLRSLLHELDAKTEKVVNVQTRILMYNNGSAVQLIKQ